MTTRSNVETKVPIAAKNTDGTDGTDGKTASEEVFVEEEELAIDPPNGGWGWVVVFSAFYCNVITDGIQFTFGVFLRDIAKYFIVEESKISLVGSLMFGILLLTGPVCSGLSNVYGIRPVTAAGSCMVALGLSLSYLSPSYEFLYFSYGILGGIGFGLIYMNTIVIASLYFTSLRALAVALVVCGSGFGTVIFALLSNELLKITDWQTSFLIEAALAGSMFPAALTFRPLKPKRIVFTTDKTLLTAKPSAISKMSGLSEMPKTTGAAIKSGTSVTNGGGSAGTVRSQKTKVYIRKNPRMSKSLVSLRTAAIEKITNVLMLQQLKTQVLRSQCCRCNCCNRGKRDHVVVVHPQERDDKYEEYDEDLQSPTGVVVSPGANTPETHPMAFNKYAVTMEKKKRCCDLTPLKKTVLLMLDFNLLRSYAFFLFSLSGGFAIASMFVYLVYEKARSIEGNGFTEDEATYLIVNVGVSNTFWRIFLGLISTTLNVDVCQFSIALALLGGASSAASALWDNIYSQHIANIGFALGMAGVAVFKPILLMELVGVDLVLNATGISLLFTGVLSIIAPPLGGLLMEHTGDYDNIYYFVAAMFVLSGLLLINVKNLRKKDILRLERQRR